MTTETDRPQDDDFDYLGPTMGPERQTFTGSATLDLSHPDDTYRVGDTERDIDAPNRPRPAADPHVVFTHEGAHDPFTVMQDLDSTEAFIVGDPAAWVALDEMA